MSVPQANAPAAGLKSNPKSAKPTLQKGAKLYTELFFEFSDGKDYDLASLQSLEPKSKLEYDTETQTRWEITLGASLKLNCGDPADKTSYIAHMPRGYRMVSDGKQGDKFLVGHVGGKGREYWYQSVAEFVPHLLWLGAPAPHDRTRCSCGPCKRMTAPKAKTKPTPTAKAPTTKRKQNSGSASSNSSAPQPIPASSGSATAATQALPTKTASPAVAVATPVAPAAPATLEAPASAPAAASGPEGAAASAATANTTSATSTAPATAPAKSSSSGAAHSAAALVPKPAPPVQLDSIYRVGEMVWFATQEGVWRIGLILSGCPEEAPDTWLIAPLGHVLLNQPSAKKSAQHMRPFLAFSLPSVEFEEAQGKTFEQVDWPALVQRYAGQDPHRRQVAGLEASKVAARCVNASFSTFNRVQQQQKQPGQPDRAVWGGVFLGPEMIRVGDAVRVRRHVEDLDDSPDVMEVRGVLDGGDGRVVLAGDVWRWQLTALEDPPPQTQPRGRDFLRELRTYNEVLRVQGGRLDWVLVEKDAVRREPDVFGRFYVTFELVPELQDKLAVEHIPEHGMSRVNERLRAGDGFYVGRRESRRATFGDAVSGQLNLGPGILEGS